MDSHFWPRTSSPFQRYISDISSLGLPQKEWETYPICFESIYKFTWNLEFYFVLFFHKPWQHIGPQCCTTNDYNPFTPKSNQFQIFPAVSPEILHHTVWRMWLCIAYSDWKMIILPILPHSYRLGEFTFWTWEWKSQVKHKIPHPKLWSCPN